MNKLLAIGIYFGYLVCVAFGSVKLLTTQQTVTNESFADTLDFESTYNLTFNSLIYHEEEHIEQYETDRDWIPWRRINFKLECAVKNHSFYDFPDDLFTQEQRLQGAILLHFIGLIYFFTVTAVIINDYFLPSVECICDDLKLSKDVAAATFMATATTMPEFFSNTISTFIAESDMGVGNVLGSLMFNMLGVSAVIGFVDTAGGKMEWWQATRDCFLLGLNIALLSIFAWDTHIQWWEALILLSCLILYYTIMFQNERVKRLFSKFIDEKWNCCFRLNRSMEKEKQRKIKEDMAEQKEDTNKIYLTTGELVEPDETMTEPNVKQRKSLWRLPTGTKLKKFWWYYTWPIKLILTICIPSPKTYRFLYPLSFIMCIVCIGLNSYVTVWMLTTIGYTFSIPESVMGLTFLSWGGCLPELFAGLITASKGQGGTNFSNSLGTNSLSILFSLGLPWFIRGVINLGQGKDSFVKIGSYGIEFIILSLIFIIILLYVVFYCTNYHLTPTASYIFISIYVIFLTFAIVVELDIIFIVNCYY